MTMIEVAGAARAIGAARAAGAAPKTSGVTVEIPREVAVRRRAEALRAEALRASALARVLGGVVRRVARFLQGRGDRRDARRDALELERLSTRMLADIGFIRDEYDGVIQRAANDEHDGAASPRRVA